MTAVLSAVLQPPHVVNLNDPDRTIIVQLIKGCCAMSVVERYKQLAKFNLRELSIPEEQPAEGTKLSSAIKPHAADHHGLEEHGAIQGPAQEALAQQLDCSQAAVVLGSSAVNSATRFNAEQSPRKCRR